MSPAEPGVDQPLLPEARGDGRRRVPLSASRLFRLRVRLSPRHRAFLVWSSWAALSGGAIAGAFFFGYPLPIRDELSLVPYVSGARPVTWSWLWSLYGDHRLPLPRLIYVVLVRASGRFESVAVFNVLAASVAAAVLLVALHRNRGHLLVTDLFVPLALLQWGQHALVRGFNIQFACATALSTIWLAGVLVSGSSLTRRTALLTGGCIGGLVLCGGSGVLLVPVLALWLLYAAWHRRLPEKASDRTELWIPIVFASLSLVLVFLYFAGYQEGVSVLSDPAGWGTILRTTLQFLAIGIGPWAAGHWMVVGTVLLGIGLIVGVRLMVTARQEPERRLTASALVSFLLANLLLALAVGWSRGGSGPTAGLAPRYVLVATPWLLGLYTSSLVLEPIRGSRMLRWILLTTLLLALPGNFAIARQERLEWKAHLDEVTAEARAGLPPAALAQRYWSRLVRHRPGTLAARWRQIQTAGLPPYDRDRPLRQVRVEPLARLARQPLPSSPPRPRVIRHLSLRDGTVLTQEIVPGTSGELYRIDLLLASDPSVPRRIPPLCWQLRTGVEEGADRILAQGWLVDPMVTSDGYVVILLDPLRVSERESLALHLSWPDGSHGAGIEVPLFAAEKPGGPTVVGANGLSLRGFLFLSRESVSPGRETRRGQPAPSFGRSPDE